MPWSVEATVRRSARPAVVVPVLLAQSIGPAATGGRPASAVLSDGGQAETAARAAVRAQAPTGFWQFREVQTRKQYCADRATLGPGAVRPDECTFSLADGTTQGTIVTTDVDNKNGMYGGVMTWGWAPEVSLDMLKPGEQLGLGARIAEHPQSDRSMGGYFRCGSKADGKDVFEGGDIPGATPAVAPTVTPKAAAASFTGPIRFVTNVANERLAGESTSFPAGTARVYVYFQRQNAPGGTPDSVRWSRAGQVVNACSYTMPVEFGPDGPTWIRSAPTGGFSPGSWEVVLSLGGTDVLRGSFTVR